MEVKIQEPARITTRLQRQTNDSVESIPMKPALWKRLLFVVGLIGAYVALSAIISFFQDFNQL
jgi:hypothetical protein